METKRSHGYDQDPVLAQWVNPYYLRPSTIAAVRESARSKPYAKYAVLDSFFNEAVLAGFARQCKALRYQNLEKGNPFRASGNGAQSHLPLADALERQGPLRLRPVALLVGPRKRRPRTDAHSR